MIDFKTNGVYIRKHNANEDGYYTQKNDGGLKKHKYGFFDKLYDIHRYGKTQELSYSYFCFQYFSKANVIILRTGTIVMELSDLIKDLENKSISDKYDNKEYKIVQSNKIIFDTDKISGQVLITYNGGQSLSHELISLYDGKPTTSEYTFFNFPDQTSHKN